MDGTLVGLDFGATDIKIGCFDMQLELLGRAVVSTNADQGPESVVERIAAAIEQLVAEAGSTPDSIAAAGIGTNVSMTKSNKPIVAMVPIKPPRTLFLPPSINAIHTVKVTPGPSMRGTRK